MEASRLKTASKPKKEMPKISDAPAEGVHSDFGHVPEYLQVRFVSITIVPSSHANLRCEG